jgi:hypothetical protein
MNLISLTFFAIIFLLVAPDKASANQFSLTQKQLQVKNGSPVCREDVIETESVSRTSHPRCNRSSRALLVKFEKLSPETGMVFVQPIDQSLVPIWVDRRDLVNLDGSIVLDGGKLSLLQYTKIAYPLLESECRKNSRAFERRFVFPPINTEFHRYLSKENTPCFKQVVDLLWDEAEYAN